MRLESRAYHAILGVAVLLGLSLAGPSGTLQGVAPGPSDSGVPPPLAVPAAAQDEEMPVGPREDDEARFHALGSAPCRTCHRAVWQAWEGTAHARAAEPLEFDERLAPDCQPCHLPYDEVEPGVGCEACHGPGSAYAALAVMIDPYKRERAGLEDAAAGCVDCHNPGHPFHQERDLEAAIPEVHPVSPAGR